jgi:predicted MFS family arabinose efflux permease
VNPLRSYLLVTAAYWGFMLTDGALRMLALLHFHQAGFNPIQLAFLFLLYEFCGMLTNAGGGWLAQHYGLRITLIAGLALQVAALLMLSGIQAHWPILQAVAYVMAAQALSGIAKDLTKMSAKTAVKFLAPPEQSGALFRWVAVLTGSKNAVKGIGFFVGGALLSTLGFREALWSMAGAIALLLIIAQWQLPASIGELRSKPGWRQLMRQNPEVRRLSAARVFLFGARDVWFVVGLPVYASAVLGCSFHQVGAFMALWIIGYGGVQAVAPKLLGRHRHGRVTVFLAIALALNLLAILGGLRSGLPPRVVLVVGLLIFAAIFAINSSLHSYLILHYAEREQAALALGYYYMANASGRLLGTLCSGLCYQFGGLPACLLGALAFLLVTAIISWRLPTPVDTIAATGSAERAR